MKRDDVKIGNWYRVNTAFGVYVNAECKHVQSPGVWAFRTQGGAIYYVGSRQVDREVPAPEENSSHPNQQGPH